MENNFDIYRRFDFDYLQGQVVEFLLPDLETTSIGVVCFHRHNYVILEDGRNVAKGLIFNVTKNGDEND